jgi:anthranilate synthase/aminodeoxychorismate synthase-like glutamine amidotransferase
MSARVLLIDNYDSFTYNLVQGLRMLGAEVLVYRNDTVDPGAARALAPSHLVISPGPGAPREAGCSSAMIAAFAGALPVLGVCLGHQCIVDSFGGRVGAAARLMHGKTSQIHHDARGVYRELPRPFTAGRYHSLAANEVPDVLEVSAHSEDGEVMGVRHRHYAVEGVQFHPESVLTPVGQRLLENFLAMTQPRWA